MSSRMFKGGCLKIVIGVFFMYFNVRSCKVSTIDIKVLSECLHVRFKVTNLWVEIGFMSLVGHKIVLTTILFN